MVTLTIQENPVEAVRQAKTGTIRRFYDETNLKWYFSIVDVIAVLTHSTDARNYWKVLKNRLKKTQNELVTKCNQLKLKAKDGKYYLTDTADSETMLKIIENVPKASIEALKELISDVKELAAGNYPSVHQIELRDEKPLDEILETPKKPKEEKREVNVEEKFEEGESELLVDGYQTEKEIFIVAFIAGADPEKIKIKVETKKVFISGKRQQEEQRENSENGKAEYLCQELYWSTFSREVHLPSSVVENVFEKNEENSRLTIKLTKI